MPSWPGTGQSGGMWGWMSLGVWGSQHPSQPEGLCRLLRGRLPAGSERGRALAGSRQWRLGHPHLQPEILQGGPGSDPPASGDVGWGVQQAGPPWEPSLCPWSGAGCVGKGVRGSPRGSGQRWVCGRGVSGGPGGSPQCTVPSCSITAWCPPTTAPYRPSPSTPAPTTSSSPTRTSR